MNPIENLTVCVTSFRRASHLERALHSIRQAGIGRVAIAAVEPTEDVVAVIRRFQAMAWISFDHVAIDDDIGCNATWMVAAYQARTERIIILHDDDVLKPAFGEHYAELIDPVLSSRMAGFATWEAELTFDDYRTEPCAFGKWEPGIRPASDLLEVVGRFGRLSLSPIVSVLDRATTIAAVKEAEQTLTANVCLHRPGMLLGTEVLVYLRHIRKFKRWLYLNTVLSGYGSHDGSGTVQAQRAGAEQLLAAGYDVARWQGAREPIENPTPRVLLTWSHMRAKDSSEQVRFSAAELSWQWLFSTGLVVPLPIHPDRAPNVVEDLPMVKDIMRAAASHAQPEDVVLYVNMDNGLTTETYERVLAGVGRALGACACPRRNLTPQLGRLYRSVLNCPTTGGYDAFAFTPHWWNTNEWEFPDMVLGREAWDTVLRILMHEKATGEKIAGVGLIDHFAQSPANCDDVCWHTEHMSRWQVDRHALKGNLANLHAAQGFFAQRGIKFTSPSLRPSIAG